MIVDSPRHGKARVNGAGTTTDFLSDRQDLALFSRFPGLVEAGIGGTFLIFDLRLCSCEFHRYLRSLPANFTVLEHLLNHPTVGRAHCRGAHAAEMILQLRQRQPGILLRKIRSTHPVLGSVSAESRDAGRMTRHAVKASSRSPNGYRSRGLTRLRWRNHARG